MGNKIFRSLRSFRSLALAGIIALATSATAASASTVGGSFTYQGQLRNRGTVYSGTCDLRFDLFDTATGGTARGSVNRAGTTVSNGLFTVELDFGSEAFTGEARYLEISAACPAGGTPSTMSPRQALTPAPYAIGLRPGAKVIGTAPLGFSSQTAPDESGNCNAAVFGRYGAGSALCPFIGAGVWGDSDNRIGIAGTSQGHIGVYGYSESDIGVLGVSNNRNSAVEGNNIATTGNTIGVTGRVTSTSGTGVYGLAENTSGTIQAIGVHGQSDAVKGIGVLATGSGRFSSALSFENGSFRNVGAGLDSTTPIFIHQISKANLCFTDFATVLNNLYANGDPSAILFSQPVGQPGSDPAFVHDSKPVQVMYTGPSGWYDCPANRWILVSAAAAGALNSGMRYNVMVVKP